MKDLEIQLENKPGALAEMAETLVAENINIEGGGAWMINHESIAHFLVEDADRAQIALENKKIKVIGTHNIVILKLKQEIPGQLGKFTCLLGDKGITIKVMYSDHHNQLILIVDNHQKARKIADEWMKNFNN